MPSREGVSEFQALYRQAYGIELSETQALEGATLLLHLIFFGLTPLPDASLPNRALPDVSPPNTPRSDNAPH